MPQRPRTVQYPHRGAFAAPEITTITDDGAIPVDVDGIYLVTKGSAAALTLAAPGAKNLGRRVTVIAGSDYAHVVTTSGGHDGTTGAHTALTMVPFIGSKITFTAFSASQWEFEYSTPRDEITTIAGDGAIPVNVDGVYLLTKGSAAAISLALPGAANIGRRITLIGGSDFAHVVTAASTGVHDGTTGGHGTLTSPAFEGGSLTLRAVTAAKWAVEANNLWVIT